MNRHSSAADDRTVAAFSARARFAELLRRVAAGERFVITRSGQPVAELRPVEEAVDRKRVQRAVAGLLRSRKGTSLGGLSLRQLIDEGRK